MKSFVNWMEKRVLAETLGVSPISSALKKVEQNQGQMPFTNTFTSQDIMAQQLGLEGQEVQALQQAGLIKGSGTAMNIDQNKFTILFRSTFGVNPKIGAPKTYYPPPPMTPNGSQNANSFQS